MDSKNTFGRRSFLYSTLGCTVGATIGSQPCRAVPQTQLFGSANSNPEIWDLHGHLAGVAGSTPLDRVKGILKYADRMHIQRLCIYMGLRFIYDPSPDELRQQNDEVLEALQFAPDRLLGFVYLNPKHLQASLDELDRCVAQGPMVGVKLWVATKANSPNLSPLVERATELGALVFQHSWLKVGGNLSGESSPHDVAELAKRHSRATIVCGHAGGDWEQGIRAIRDCENVSVDLGGGDPTAGFVEMAVRELGAERVLFGSDVPGRSFATQLAKVLGAQISPAAKQLIFADNLKRLLKPIMQKRERKS